jgi:Do/DeqQ family serine protease
MKDQAGKWYRRQVHMGVAVLGAVVLSGGIAWHGLAADSRPASEESATVSIPAVTPSPAIGRDSYADIVKVVAPAVVTIRSEGRATTSPTALPGDDLFRRFFRDQLEPGPRAPRSFKRRGLGSGVVISGDGYILTNHHVVEDADRIFVDFIDGRTFTATLVGSDKPSDLALLRIEAANLRPLTLGDSDAVQVGDVVLAIGNPLNIGQTVTMGIISAKGRATGVGDGSYEDFLQTDAPINHGNSGGALVSTKGELIGINSQILSTTGENIGIGFAIPANMARHVADQLRKSGRVRRAQLGVTIQPVTSDMAASLGLTEVAGAIVSRVEPGSAADRAGLRRGDVIRGFNGQPVNDFNALRNRVANSPPGAAVTIAIVRDGTRRDVTVTLDEASASRSARQVDEPADEDKAALGITVAPLTPDTAARAGVPRTLQGLLVEQVDPDGRAADAGIRAGDIIQEVNRQGVRTVEELRSVVRGRTDRPLLLLINRDGRDLFVTVRPAA